MNEQNVQKKVIVVDDEAVIVRILSIMLKNAGFNVVATTRSAEAVDLVRKEKPNLVLLDLLMPEVSGFEVLKRVRTFSAVPVIVLSARDDAIEETLRLGANDFVSKPFDPPHLVQRIRAVLSAAQQKKPEGGTAAAGA